MLKSIRRQKAWRIVRRDQALELEPAGPGSGRVSFQHEKFAVPTS
jgi:hypothetical protein